MLKTRQLLSHSKWAARNFATSTHVKQKLQEVEGSENLEGNTSPRLRLPACQMPNMMDIGCRSIFDEDHDIFRSSVRKFMRNELAPEHKRYEAQGCVDREMWNRMGEQGFLGTSIAAEKGGIGGTFKDEAIVLEEQIYANCHAPAIGLHGTIVMPYFANYGTQDQKDYYMPKLCSGEMVAAIAMTEPDAGSDLQGIRTNAKRDGDDFILNGSKVFITNANAKAKAHGISLFVVEDGMKGFKKGRNLNKLGMKAHDTAELFFEDVRLPKTALLGGLNKGFYHLMTELPQERLQIGITAIADCEWMFEETRNYINTRKAFGRPLSGLQTIQHKMAEMKTSIAVCRAFMDQCIELLDKKQLDNAQASMAKYYASDLENKIAAECLQLHGGWGFMMETPIARSYVDARVQTIYGGTNEVMKDLIARTIVAKPGR